MKRVLLILEDYNELLYVETLLKKVGFDAMGTQKIKGLNDTIMTFRPSVLIVSELIKDIKAEDFITELKSEKPDLKAMILLNSQTKKRETKAVDAYITRPIDPLVVLKTVAYWSGMNEEKLLEKIDKLALFKGTQHEEHAKTLRSNFGTKSEVRIISGERTEIDLKFVKQSQEQMLTRSNRFKDALKSMPDPKAKIYDHKIVSKETKEFREREKDPEIVDIDNERKAFVDALFDKAKKTG